MESVIQVLESLSFREEPAMTASRAIGTVREELSGEARAPFSYEILYRDEPSIEAFVERVVPKLVYFAECTNRRLPACKGLFLSIFAGDRLFFVHAGDFLKRAAELKHVAVGELARRYGPAEERSAGPPLLLLQ